MKKLLKAALALLIAVGLSRILSANTSWNFISILGVMIGATSLTIGIVSSKELIASKGGRSIFGGGGGAGGGGSSSSQSDPDTGGGAGGAGGGGGGGTFGSGGDGGDYINRNVSIDVENLHDYGGEADVSTLAEPNVVTDDSIEDTISEEQLENLKDKLDLTSGTLDFRMSSGNIFKDKSLVRILDIQSKSGKVHLRLSRNSGGKLVFTHDDMDNGTARAEVELDGLEDYSSFRVFLVWSLSEIRLHIGPEDTETSEERELREDRCIRI